MLRVIMLLEWITEVRFSKKKNDNFKHEIVKYRFAGKFNCLVNE